MLPASEMRVQLFPNMSLAVGMRLGPYEILAPLGAGGMGEVYRARDTQLGRDVAIKVLPPSLAANPERMARFSREAKVLAALNHPNIAAIYGLEGSAIVMELIEGPTLAERIKEGLDLAAALRIALQIAEALEAAHDKGIVHRDLKPANVKAPHDGPVKVLDLGLATALPGTERDGDSQSLSNSPTLTMGATEAGMIMGTAAYMSPEQAAGRRVDKRADIWSFGVVLWEMITGRRLFDGGESAAHTLADVLRAPVEFGKLPSSTPRPIVDLIKRCLDRDVKTRLRDMGEARVAITRYLANPETAADQERIRAAPRARLGWTVAAIMTLAAAALAALWLKPAPAPQAMRFEIHAPAGKSLPLGTPAPSPDGRMIAYTVRDPSGLNHIHVRPIDRVESRELPGTENAYHPFWSPDSRSLAFATRTGRAFQVIDLAGGNPRPLADVVGPWHGSWNQFGDILIESGDGVSRVSAEGGAATPVLKRDQVAALGGPGFPQFLDDGKRFLLTFRQGRASIQMAAIGSTELHMVLDGASSAAILAPVPTGKTYLLFMRGSGLMAQEFDQRSGNLRGQAALIVNDIGRVANPPLRPAVGVSNGIIAYQNGGAGGGSLIWRDRSGKAIESLPPEASGTNIKLSPDGSQVAFNRTDDSGNEDVWITDLKRKSSTRITFDPGRERVGPWSPDGKRLTYVFEGRAIHTIDVADTTRNQVVPGVEGRPESWSPDGKYLVVYRQGVLSMAPVLAGEKTVRIGSQNGSSEEARFSPDGKYIAFDSYASGEDEVYVQPTPPPAGIRKVSIGGGSLPRWRGDGKELYYMSPEGGMMAVDLKFDNGISVGVPHELFRLPPRDFNGGYDVRADGRAFLNYGLPQESVDSPIVVMLNWWTEFFK